MGFVKGLILVFSVAYLDLIALSHRGEALRAGYELPAGTVVREWMTDRFVDLHLISPELSALALKRGRAALDEIHRVHGYHKYPSTQIDYFVEGPVVKPFINLTVTRDPETLSQPTVLEPGKNYYSYHDSSAQPSGDLLKFIPSGLGKGLPFHSYPSAPLSSGVVEKFVPVRVEEDLPVSSWQLPISHTDAADSHLANSSVEGWLRADNQIVPSRRGFSSLFKEGANPDVMLSDIPKDWNRTFGGS